MVDDTELLQAIESCFKDVDPILSNKAYENSDHPHITFAIKCKDIQEISQARVSLYLAVKYHNAKLEGLPMETIGDKRKATLVWRMYPQVSTYDDGDGEWHKIVCRCSWWVR